MMLGQSHVNKFPAACGLDGWGAQLNGRGREAATAIEQEALIHRCVDDYTAHTAACHLLVKLDDMCANAVYDVFFHFY